MGLYELDKRIKALIFALDYVPGEDENHSHSIIIKILYEYETAYNKLLLEEKARAK